MRQRKEGRDERVGEEEGKEGEDEEGRRRNLAPTVISKSRRL